MPPVPVLGWWRLGLLAVAVLALLLVATIASRQRAASRLPVINAGDLVAGPERAGAEVVIAGEWVRVGPTSDGHLHVIVRGHQGRQVMCHFEDVPVTDRAWLESGLPTAGPVYIHGRVSGTENGLVCLRGCRIIR